MSNDKRIGLAIHSYIGTNVKQIVGKTYVQLARGRDEFKYHEYESRPNKFMSKKNLIFRDKTNIELQKILYNDAVAMTGGQPLDGVPTPQRISHQLFGEGVS